MNLLMKMQIAIAGTTKTAAGSCPVAPTCSIQETDDVCTTLGQLMGVLSVRHDDLPIVIAENRREDCAKHSDLCGVAV